MTGVFRFCILLSIFWLLSGQMAKGQELIVRGKFLTDSVKIGESLPYLLTAKYTSNLNVLFPDSTHLFAPFEYSRRKYFPTRTTAGVSMDSVVYYLRTFETDLQQPLSLPVYVVHASDCTAVYTTPDSVLLKSVILPLPDSLRLQDLLLKETVAFEPLPYTFNYITAIFIAGVLLGTSVIGWILFGAKIQRYYLIKRLQKNHERFMKEYTGHLERIQGEAPAELAETAVNVWKKYMENLDRQPYTKLTTKETMRLIRDTSIVDNLHMIDRAIYGNYKVSAQPFKGLGNFAEAKFSQRLEEVKNG